MNKFIGFGYSMIALTKALQKEGVLKKIIAAVEEKRLPCAVNGVSRASRSCTAASIIDAVGKGGLVICPDDASADAAASDLSSLLNRDITVIKDRDFIFYGVNSASRQAEQARLAAFAGMRENGVCVATVAALSQRTMPPEVLSELSFEINMTDVCGLAAMTEKLTLAGYARADQVEGAGQFAVRGFILDVFSPVYENPVRVEFWDDEIDSISFFDAGTQRRTERVEKALILPCRETMECGVSLAELLENRLQEIRDKIGLSADYYNELTSDIEKLRGGIKIANADKYIELLYDSFTTALDYIPAEMPVFLTDCLKCGENGKAYSEGILQEGHALAESGLADSTLLRYALSYEDLCDKFKNRPLVMLDTFLLAEYPLTPVTEYVIKAKHLPSYADSMDTALSDVAGYLKMNYSVIVLCSDPVRARKMHEFLTEHGIPCRLDSEPADLSASGCCVAVGALSCGIEFTSAAIALITEGQVFSQAVKTKKKHRSSADSNRKKIASYTDLAPGDLVVHDAHGIGRFVCVQQMKIDGAVRDYIKIAYAGSDVLYVPATSLNLVSKYIGGGEDTPVRLSKMGGTDWFKTKSKAKESAKEMAKELIALYAERQQIKGHAFAADSRWQREFEDAFGYVETDDQLRCIEEIKADMEKETPMERLLCGDVGYGKTEVALRAVMKCILDGYQAAILVPTTVLARQHYLTVLKRFADFPVKAAVLSRFSNSAALKKSLAEIEQGSVDIVIGTHKLLQKDVKFKKLGLLIVDEEQRFGVSHKEKLKEITTNVDVLTLSATPIPRTLNMAMSGIRDMSVIEQPPGNRRPVQTFVLEYSRQILLDAMRRELARGGQVYYLHNRIDTIARRAASIAEALPDAGIAVAHGRMSREELSDVMQRMADGEIQILVCTTIIETGIDIPNVNTLIIEDADKMGLSQLHQIRGRVGRSSRKAFAYLTFRPGKSLSEVAEKRLAAIKEFAEFNSGFKIALRDLEIRGAGNLLGAEQSGHMLSVGYDMYLKLLNEAVEEEKGTERAVCEDCTADLPISANIPDTYVPSSEQRLDLYRRIALISDEDEADDMTDELIDRFGDVPESVLTLINIALMRTEAAKAGVSDITMRKGVARMKLASFDMQRLSRLYSMKEYKNKVKIEAGTEPAMSYRPDNKNPVREITRFLRDYRGLS